MTPSEVGDDHPIDHGRWRAGTDGMPLPRPDVQLRGRRPRIGGAFDLVRRHRAAAPFLAEIHEKGRAGLLDRNARDAAIVVLRTRFEMTHQEIADAMGISVASVNRILRGQQDTKPGFRSVTYSFNNVPDHADRIVGAYAAVRGMTKKAVLRQAVIEFAENHRVDIAAVATPPSEPAVGAADRTATPPPREG